MEEFMCVRMQFGNVPLRGGFCLQRASTGQCAQPFAFPLPEARESLSGAASALYCGVNEELTSCDAVRVLVNNELCEDDFECTAPGGVCREVGLLGLRCTYECGFANECLPGGGSGSTCGDANGSAEEDYCGG
jgi:hypothetical protein